jgi:hypothetical protein
MLGGRYRRGLMAKPCTSTVSPGGFAAAPKESGLGGR